MTEDRNPMEVVGRASKRAAYHLLQALVEGLKAVEAVIEEIGDLRDHAGGDDRRTKQRIEIE